MSRLFKGLGLLIAVTCVVWVAVLWRWQSTGRETSVEDMLVYLLLLPLVVFALALLARWAWRGAAARATPAAPAVAPAAPSADVLARHASWQLLDARAHTAVAATLDELLEAAAAHAPRPGLDAALRHADGLPVMCARAADIDVASTLQRLEPLLAEAQARHPQLQPGEAFARALALLEGPLVGAVLALAPWAQALGGQGAAPAGDAAAEPAPYEPRVRVIVAWPAGLNALERELAQQWLAQVTLEAAQGIVEPSRWRLPPPQAAELTLTGPQLWHDADALFEHLRRDGERQDLVLLLAAHSDISPEAVARLEAAGQLFSSARPRARIPGEAAAALVLAPSAWPAPPADEADADAAPVPHLHRAAFVQRDKSVDAPGRIAQDHAPLLVRQALVAARAEGTQLAAVVSDADQHTPRAAELFTAMLDVTPQIDPNEDMRMFGQLCGHLGPVGMLLVAAGAARCATRLNEPCLALSLCDERWRAALVARPAAPANPTTAAVAPAPAGVSS